MKNLLLIVISISLFSGNIFAAENATVSFAQGKVSVKSTSNPKDKWRTIKKGDKVEEGETIMTGNGSSVTFIYNSSEFKISANSTLVLKDLPTKDKSGNVEVSAGFAWFKMENLGKSGFKATTPASTAGVRGTAFATMYEPKVKTAMNCICHGKVEVNTSAENAPLMVEKGFGSVVVAGESKVNKTSYKDDIVNGEALPSFQKKVKESPILKNCLSCHKTKDWKMDGLIKDETYGK